jgi:hypothetical protein
MTQPGSDNPMEFSDSEESELRALAELQGFIRYEKEACKLEEERQQAEEQRAKAWEGYADAADARLRAEARLGRDFLVVLNTVCWVIIAVVFLIRGLT